MPLHSEPVTNPIALEYYQRIGHKISDGGMHDLHDCPLCQGEIRLTSGWLEDEPSRLARLFATRGKCRACYIFDRKEPCTHGPV